MKKVLTTLLSALLLAGLATTVGAWEENVDYVSYGEITSASYPASTKVADKVTYPECTSGSLLKGTIIAGLLNGADCASGNVATNAFDGDTATVFTGIETTQRSYVGLILDQAYELTEVRVRPGDGKPADRLHGLVVEGSNDGIHWAKIIEHRQDAQGTEYHIFTPQTVTEQSYLDAGYTVKKDHSLFWCGNGGSYSIYRVWSLGCELNVGEIEFYGNPAEATVLDDQAVADLIPTTTWFPGNINIRDAIIEKPLVSTEGSVLGKVIAAGGTWARSYPERAFDGDNKRAFDPCFRGTNCWVGMLYDEPYVMTEVWVRPRRGNFGEIEGAMIQGSLDGKTWVTLVQYAAEDIPAAQDWVKKPIADQGGYTYFRYVTSVLTHGAIADIAFFGAPGAAATNIPAAQKYPVATYETFAGEFIDTGIVSTSVDGSITGTVFGYGDLSFLGRDPWNPGANISYESTFDGDISTWTAYEKNGALSFAGIKTDVPYVVTEVKVCPEKGSFKSISGAHVQGSVDGINWVDLAVFTDADVPAEQAWVSKAVDGADAYTYFRYALSDYNGYAIAEVALYGTAAEAPETEAPFEVPAGTYNIATIGIISTSSANDVSAAFDGNLATGVSLGGSGNGMWLGAKLNEYNQSSALYAIRLATYDTDGDGRTDAPHRLFKTVVEGSNDGETWEQIAYFGDPYTDFEDFAADHEAGNDYWVKYFDFDVSYKYYRVWNDDGNDFWGEVEIWVSPIEAPETEAPETEAPGKAEIDLVDATVKNGDTVEVVINIATTVPVNAVALYELTYDAAVLEFVEFTGFGDIVTDSFFGTDAVDNTQKTIMFALENATELNGLVAGIKFNAIAAGTTEVTLSAIVKHDSEVIETVVDSAIVTVEDFVVGDIDANNELDIKDVLLLFQHAMMPELYPIEYNGAIDFNADGLLDIKDALRLFQGIMLPDLYPLV